jgi:hypothetical protein
MEGPFKKPTPSPMLHATALQNFPAVDKKIALECQVITNKSRAIILDCIISISQT